MCIDRWKNKDIVYAYSVILFNFKCKEILTFVTVMDESEGQDAQPIVRHRKINTI